MEIMRDVLEPKRPPSNFVRRKSKIPELYRGS